MTFIDIEIRGRLESLLKIKGASRDRFIRFEDTNSKYRGFRLAL